MLSANKTILGYPTYMAKTHAQTYPARRGVRGAMEVRAAVGATGCGTGTCVPGSLHQLLREPPGASRQHAVPRENLAQVPWPPRTRTACTGGARPAAHPWPCTQHRACRARGTCGTAHVAGPRPVLCGSARAPRAGGCYDRLSVLLSRAPCAPARCLPPTPTRARAHTRTHTRTRTRARRPALCVPDAKPNPARTATHPCVSARKKSITRATRPDPTCHPAIPPPPSPSPRPAHTRVFVRAERTCLPASAATAHAQRRASPPAVRPQANS